MNTIGVLARPDLVDAGPVVRQLGEWLCARGVHVCTDEATAALAGQERARGLHRRLRPRGGGAGGGARRLRRRRHAARGEPSARAADPGAGRQLRQPGLPDRGCAWPSCYPTLAGVLEGRYAYEDRRLLRAVVKRRDRPEVTADVLNDVVITKAGPSRIIEVDARIDGLFVSSFRADGIVVSSPTGSTAYCLAAGGPILYPTLPAFVVTPICPHTLTNRPLVVGDSSQVELRLRDARHVEVYAALDGQETFAFADGDSVVVTGGPRRLRLVKVPGRDFYQVLRSKLKWGDAGERP